MTQELVNVDEFDQSKPLNTRQKAFAREMRVALANGGGDAELTAAYARAGYAPDRGNARRLAADPRIVAEADKLAAEALRLSGLHIAYLQTKALELLRASPTAIHRELAKFVAAEVFGSGESEVVRFRFRQDLSEAEKAELDAASWPLQELKIDKDGIIAIKLPDKRALIEMLAKQIGVGHAPGIVNINENTNVNDNSVTLEQLVLGSFAKEPA